MIYDDEEAKTESEQNQSISAGILEALQAFSTAVQGLETGIEVEVALTRRFAIS